jgi:RNA recognition motif-containing protein
MSLLDDEASAMDPGCGRASAVRQQDFYEERKGKGVKGGYRKPEPNRTLWVGNVDDRMSEAALEDLFAPMAQVTHVKIVREPRNATADRAQGVFAFVELDSPSAAAGVLEELKGQPLVSQEGRQLRVNWAADKQSDNQGGNGEAYGNGSGKGADRRRGDKGDGKRRPDGREVSKGGKDDGRKSGGKGNRTGDRTRAELDYEADQQAGASSTSSKNWAYMDPHGEVQVGFSTDDMRQWFECGYFEKGLLVALVQDPGGGRKPKPPHRRNFFELREWFPDASKAFTYVPKF